MVSRTSISPLEIFASKIRLFSLVSRGEIDILAIRRPRKLIHPVVELRQQVFGRLCGAVVEEEAEFVAFVAGAELAAPREVFAVGGVGGVEVAAFGCADLHRLGCGVGEVEGEDVGVGADGGLGVEVLSECQFLGVGREGESAAALEGEGRDVVGIVGR